MKDDTSPATKGDINRLEATIKAEFKDIRADIKKMKVDLERQIKDLSESLNRAIDKVLSIPIGISKQLADQAKEHDKRIKRLERHVGLVAS